MCHLDSQGREEALFNAADHELCPHVEENNHTLVAFGNCQQLQEGDPFGAKILEDFHQPQLQSVDLQSEVFESDEEVRGPVGEGSDSSQVHELVSHKESISPLAHHTVDILEAGHSFDAASAELTLYLFVDIVREVILNELNALEESAT